MCSTRLLQTTLKAASRLMDEPEIVRRVGGNDQDVFPCLSQLHTVREGKQWAEAREGENECAGSENGTVLQEGSAGKNRENTSTETRHKHRRRTSVPTQHDVVVFPTPPLPPTKIQRRDVWSTRFWRLGSSGSSPSMIAESAMVG